MADDDWMDTLPQAARDYLEGRRLDEVECIISDLPGIARGKAVPASKFRRQTQFHLPDSIFFQTITGDWGEAAGEEGFIERDMILKPDMSTATAAPWTADWTLQVIHDAYDRELEPIPFSPRNVLRKVVQLYHDRGWKPVVAPEMEFYLVARNIDPAKAIEPMMGRSGRPAAARQAYSMTAVDEFGPVIDDIYDFAEAQGFEIDGITQEGGAGQLEINLRHGDPIKLADEVFYFKRLIREAAMRHDCYATFMAKPIADEPGSAMHIHHSVIDKATGRRVQVRVELWIENRAKNSVRQDAEFFINTAGVLGERVDEHLALHGLARGDEELPDVEILARLDGVPSLGAGRKRLHLRAAVRMAGDAARVAWALGEKDRLHLLLEVQEVELGGLFFSLPECGGGDEREENETRK